MLASSIAKLLYNKRASFQWGRVNFIHSGWYGAVFWICAEHTVYNIEMFLLLLSRIYRSRGFPVFPTDRLMRKLGVLGRVGGGTVQTGATK